MSKFGFIIHNIEQTEESSRTTGGGTVIEGRLRDLFTELVTLMRRIQIAPFINFRNKRYAEYLGEPFAKKGGKPNIINLSLKTKVLGCICIY